MKSLLYFYQNYKKNIFLITGILLSFIFMIPFFLLGTGSIVTYHDQLDGELLNYILAAKYFFTDIRIYPEIMNGLPAAGAVPPAPLFVLFYMIFQPFTAFMLSQWVLYLVGFLGMYLLLCKLTDRELISFGVAVIFMLLPFYPVYGLCIPGQPLLFYAVLSLYQKETSVRKTTEACPHDLSSRHTYLYYLLIFFYGASSSPVLVGFACLLVIGLFAVTKSASALRLRHRLSFSPWFSLIVLLGSYILCNLGLLKQVFFPESTYVSHKTELVLSPMEPLDHLKEVLGTGLSYAQSYHTILFFLIGLCLLLFFLQIFTKSSNADKKSSSGKIFSHQTVKKNSTFSNSNRLFLLAVRVLLYIIGICLFSAFYRGNFVTELRNASGGVLKTFNLERICWLLPTAWCILAAYLLAFAASFFECKPDSVLPKSASSARRFHSGPLLIKCLLGKVVILGVLGIWGITVLSNSAIRPNLAKLLKGGDYYALDWNGFFAEDIFNQIEDAIGKPKEDYRVVSVGIYPAAAAYNGFYCLDGYSNNYPLAYKHTFRRIIEGELEKNDYIRMLFDTWGNRCYVTTAEQANYYTFEKKWGSVIYDLDLNLEVMKELNCQYVFSAAYLMDAEEKGLTLLREEPFETDGSWYHIYVYEVK